MSHKIKSEHLFPFYLINFAFAEKLKKTSILGSTIPTTPVRAMEETRKTPTVLEMCAGGGGQTIGLERAGFHCLAALEIDSHACETLRRNRPEMTVLEQDMREFDPRDFYGLDLLSAGVPCPPFSIAGKQLGPGDDRDLFPEALRIAAAVQPRAIMIENVPGFASSKFETYRKDLLRTLRQMGYEADWKVLHSSDFGVPQLRPRFVLVGLKRSFAPYFSWPTPLGPGERPTVGGALGDLMSSRDWPGAVQWAKRADRIAPTIVGGSKKHGGPDLGPTRAKRQWETLGVNGKGIADEPPDKNFPVNGLPKLTNRMVARLQSFPDNWLFSGGKTAQYRQIGNAFPPQVAFAVARQIKIALDRIAMADHSDEQRLFSCLVATGG